MQVTRDFGPLWGVSGVVSPFRALEHVPPGYIPLAIVRRRRLPQQHGFHFAAGGQPLGLIAYGDGWSLIASHELLEILCDPWGKRTAPGRSLADEKKALTSPAQVVERQNEYQDQGQVEYLVEVCDPCQHATYTINGVLLADFITPQYFDPFWTDGARYSFTGGVERPRQVLEGGYITWRTRVPHDQIWQAFAPSGGGIRPRPVLTENLRIGPLTGVAPAVSRVWVDSASADQGRPDVMEILSRGQPLRGAQDAYTRANESATSYGETLSTDIERILNSLARPPRTPRSLASTFTPSLDDVLTVLGHLATDPAFRDDFKTDPRGTLARFNIEHPIGLELPAELPTQDEYKTVLEKLRASGDPFGLPAFDQPDLANWLATLGRTLGGF
jgi:hypothetical protein